MASDDESNRDTVEYDPDDTRVVVTEPVDSPSENFLVEEKLRDMPNLFARGLVYFSLALVVAMSAYAYFGHVDLVSECRSVARPETHLMRLFADRDGYVADIFVEEGDAVEAGASLFLIRSEKNITYSAKVSDLSQTIPLKERLYDIQIELARDTLRQLESEHENTLRLLELDQQQNSLTLESTKSELQFWNREYADLLREFEGVETLFRDNLMPITEYNDLKSRLERAHTEKQKAELEKSIVLSRKEIIEKKIDREMSEYRNLKEIAEKELQNTILQKQTELQSLRSELEVNRSMLSVRDGPEAVNPAEGGTVVRAERAGTVSELYVRNPGEYVSESTMLCTVVPGDCPLYMDITVLNRDIGFIETGMEIKYKFAAFPYTDYGLLRGEVTAISPSAVENHASGFVYRVKGSLEPDSFLIDGKVHPVMPGMTATAEIVTERRSILSLLMRKMRN
jgi:HlyD family type I secretion membrane fusion protein